MDAQDTDGKIFEIWCDDSKKYYDYFHHKKKKAFASRKNTLHNHNYNHNKDKDHPNQQLSWEAKPK